MIPWRLLLLVVAVLTVMWMVGVIGIVLWAT